SKLFVVEQCGHVVNVDQPLVFNATVIKFINAMK
ncbi:alpha/beta hydrolase, partial [Flavobacterium psychrophilum]|nr:alpha/beta hydrolase [Flavobacterium psychrophilum]MCB5984899.1 alpha/beta hydrolase [Flavobacterium psychrophilum]